MLKQDKNGRLTCENSYVYREGYLERRKRYYIEIIGLEYFISNFWIKTTTIEKKLKK